jgi:hypothetical protein
MDHIRTVLPKVLRKRGLHAHAQAAVVTLRAQEWIAGALPAFAGQIAAETFSQGTLSLKAKSSIAAQECRLLFPELTAFLEHECGVTVRDVRLHR